MASQTPHVLRVLLHVTAVRRVAVDPRSVFYLEADVDDTVVRLRGRRTWRDVRAIKPLSAIFERHGFHRVHKNWTVNVERIREVRQQRDGVDWEVVLQPPVNRVIPVSRGRLQSLMRLFGE